MKKNRVSVLVGIALAAALAIAGCGGGAKNTTAPAGNTPAKAPEKQAPAAIQIGGSVPTTGKYGATGLQVKNGYELAVEAINAAGGVYVKEFDKKIPLQLTLKDDESDPNKVGPIMESLNEQQKVVAYLGGFGSDMHAAAAAVAEKNKTPYLGVAFGLESIHKQGYKYLFSPFPKSTADARIFEALADLLPKEQLPKTVAIFQEKTDWGKELGALWQEQAQKFGYQVVVYETYTPGTKDYSDMIGKAKAKGAEVLLALPTPPDGMAIAKQISELQYKPKVIFFMRAPDAPTWGENLKDLGDNVIFAPGWHYTAKFPGVEKLNQAYQAKFSKPAEPGVGPAYACIQLLADAIERAGTLDRQAIRDALAKADTMTTVGKITFDQYGIGSAQMFFNQWQKGKAQAIWPKDAASAPIVYPAR